MKKSKIIAIVGIAISVIVIVAMLTTAARPYLKVSQVTSNPAKYDNKEIQVIGVVQGFAGSDFNLTESGNSIFIDINGLTPPTDLENGIQVVVKGVFNSSLVLTANQILTQCS
ncbi:MAG: cytochrome c maturation protein CcmE [Candidatus Lokiarchaeota archaeon]|nr:cytochrome c maturation protein CcmE [Candidatus Lokiarchaeota archaeon]